MRDRIRNILMEVTAFEERPNINAAFWKWFGKSWVVENKIPKICYHGTGSDFSIFRNREFGFHFGEILKQAEDVIETGDKGDNKNIMPVYLSIQEGFEMFRDLGDWEDYESWISYLAEYEWDDGGYLDLLHRYEDRYGHDNDYENKEEKIRKLFRSVDSIRVFLKKEGYDGIYYPNQIEGNPEFHDDNNNSWIVFNPTQVKSVYNQGTWNPNSPDIMK